MNHTSSGLATTRSYVEYCPVVKVTIIKLLAIAFFCVSSFHAIAATEEDLVYYGASVGSLDAEVAKTERHQLNVKFEKSGETFYNFNIQIQEFEGTMEEYVKLSKGQFDEMFKKKYDLMMDRQDGQREYRGELIGVYGGNDLHFYYRAIKQGSKVYLITGVAQRAKWPEAGPQVKRYVESFKAQ